MISNNSCYSLLLIQTYPQSGIRSPHTDPDHLGPHVIRLTYSSTIQQHFGKFCIELHICLHCTFHPCILTSGLPCIVINKNKWVRALLSLLRGSGADRAPRFGKPSSSASSPARLSLLPRSPAPARSPWYTADR